MKTKELAAPRWATSSFATTADTLPLEMSALGEHLELCRSASGRLFLLRCGADAVHRFVAPRMMTTLAVCTLLIGLGFSFA